MNEHELNDFNEWLDDEYDLNVNQLSPAAFKEYYKEYLEDLSEEDSALNREDN